MKIKRKSKTSELKQAILNNNCNEIQKLISKRFEAENKSHLLHLAVKNKNVYAVKKLLLAKVDPNTADKEGNNCLHLVMADFDQSPLQSAAITRLLVDNGCSPNKFNNEGFAPLHLAWKLEQTEAVKYLCGLQLFDFDLQGKC